MQWSKGPQDSAFPSSRLDFAPVSQLPLTFFPCSPTLFLCHAVYLYAALTTHARDIGI